MGIGGDSSSDWRLRLGERVAVATRAAAIGVWEWRLDQSTFTCDARVRKLFDLSSDEPVTLAALTRRLTAADRRRFAEELAVAAKGAANLDSEVVVELPDGGRRWVRCTADLVRDGAGRPWRLVGASWDNSAHQRLDEAVHDREERLQITLTSIDDGVITTTATGEVVFLNPAAEALTGWTPEAARGRHVDEVLRLESPGDSDSPTLDCLRENATRRRRAARLVGSDEVLREVEITASPMRSRGGQVMGAVLVIHDITEQRALEARLRHAASHDALTGLPNRSQLDEALTRLLRPGAGDRAALCYLDIDQFKIINDTAGHHAGDQFLRQVAGLFHEHVRPGELLARLGGDEFAWVLLEDSLDNARRRAERLVEAVAQFRFHWGGQTFSAGVSAGLCAVRPDLAAAEILSQADVACYAAKGAGRGRVSVYREDESGVTARHQEIGMAARLREVIRQDRLTLYAQRIVPALPAGEDGTHVELLVRMIGEDGRLVPPGAFIPAAERFDLMAPIDRWVITEALSRLGPKIAAVPGLEISLNLSGNSLNDPGLLEEVLALVNSSPLPAERVTFEVTESAALNNLAAAGAFMGRLREAGCRIALDDFGVGLSSFAYLKTFPVDCVKIDGSFVRHIVDDATDRAIVESMNTLAHRLGARTVAEFVEDEAAARILREIGVDFLQGYAFGTPEPFEDLLISLMRSCA